MTSTETARPGLDNAERMLEERGIALGPVRIAAGRSGVVIGFPKDPMVHVSWWALAVIVVAFRLLRRR